MSRPISITSASTTVLGTYTLVSGSFNGQGASYFSGLVGKGVDGSKTTSNYYSNGSGNIVIFTYNLSFSDIPQAATITSLTCQVNGHAESTSNNNEYMCVQLYCNDAAISDETNFKSLGTSNTTTTLTATTLPTMANLSTLKLRCRLGYYGGAINGATATLEYSVNGTAYTVTAESTYTGATVSPATQEVMNGESAVVQIYPDDLNSIIVEDNGTDVTDQLQYVIPTPGTQTFTGIPTSYDATNSVYDSIYEGTTDDGLAPNTSTSRICVYVAQTANAEGKLTYNFDCSSIPSNATITSVSCVAAAACHSNGQYFDTKTVQLYNGNTAKGTATTITGNGNTRTDHNINGGSWTRSELDNIKIVIRVQRGTNTSQSSFSFWGATLTVNYTLPSDPYYTYTITNISADHDILVSESIIVPPEEDQTKTYYSVTISSINAITEPGRGTTRVESGTGQTITITPLDPQLTLALDNGVDVSSQLVAHGTAAPTSAVTTVQGASYGFTLNSSTGYYVSNNTGVNKSAALCKVDFDLPVRCLVTIQFINYAEAAYDFGVFGNIDVPLSTNYYAAGSGGATITDNDYKLACNTNTYNTSTPQTITYEIAAGQHSVYIKYSKDDATADNNDTLQFKVTNIETLEPSVGYYTYDLTSINADHSLVFIFGDVTYYFVTSSTESNAKLYPDGQMVELPGETYKLTIVPENSGDTITVRDNNVDVTSSLERKEVVVEKGGQQVTVVNYIYHINNVQTGHTVVVYSASVGNIPYMKVNNSWVQVRSIYKKENGSWVEQEPSIDIFDNGTIYIKGN